MELKMLAKVYVSLHYSENYHQAKDSKVDQNKPKCSNCYGKGWKDNKVDLGNSSSGFELAVT